MGAINYSGPNSRRSQVPRYLVNKDFIVPTLHHEDNVCEAESSGCPSATRYCLTTGTLQRDSETNVLLLERGSITCDGGELNCRVLFGIVGLRPTRTTA